MVSNGRSLTSTPTQLQVISITMPDVDQTSQPIRENQMALKEMIEYMEVCSDQMDHGMPSAAEAEAIVNSRTHRHEEGCSELILETASSPIRGAVSVDDYKDRRVSDLPPSALTLARAQGGEAAAGLATSRVLRVLDHLGLLDRAEVLESRIGSMLPVKSHLIAKMRSMTSTSCEEVTSRQCVALAKISS